MGGGLLSWKSRQEGGDLLLQEIQVRGGLKKRPHPSGRGMDFFWNNPINERLSFIQKLANSWPLAINPGSRGVFGHIC